MKRNYLGTFAGALMALAKFATTTFIIVLSVVLEPLFSVKTYALLCGRTLSDFALMMFATAISGAVFIGNKLAGTMATTATDVGDMHGRRMYA